jgi:hypothetical protein
MAKMVFASDIVDDPVVGGYGVVLRVETRIGEATVSSRAADALL